MSILTTFALMATAVVAKLRQEDKPPSFVCGKCGAESFNPNDIRERYCGRCHVFELKTKIDELTSERDDWRRMAEGWRAHRLAESAPQILRAQAEQQRHAMENAQYQQAQANQQMAQNFYSQGLAGGILGLAQAQAQTLNDFCNCVPARHDMFLRG